MSEGGHPTDDAAFIAANNVATHPFDPAARLDERFDCLTGYAAPHANATLESRTILFPGKLLLVETLLTAMLHDEEGRAPFWAANIEYLCASGIIELEMGLRLRDEVLGSLFFEMFANGFDSVHVRPSDEASSQS